MLKIKIVVSPNVFELEGETPYADVRPLLDQWFEAITKAPLTQAQIDQWTARVAASNDKVQDVVEKREPSS